MRRPYFFRHLYLETTRSCNLRCPHCMVGCNDERFVRKRACQELSFEEIVELLLKPGRELGVCELGFSGGEFLLREDAMDLVRVASLLGYDIRVLSNGLLVTSDLLERLKRASGGRVGMIFGINSITDEDLNRRTRQADLDVTLQALELCRRHRVRRHVVVTIGRFNLDTLPATLDWLVKHHLPFNRAPLTARNSGRAFFAENAFTRRDMEEIIHPALRRHFHGYVSQTPFFLSPELHEHVSGGESRNVTVPQNPSIGCWCGSWIAVGPEGDVSPCSILLDELVAGNVRERSLYEIIDQSKVFQDFLDRNRLQGRCGRCRYRQVCGGCRAMAWFHSGDYMAEDPTCFFEPEDESTVSPYEEETNRVFLKYVRFASRSGMYTQPCP